ncbi:MAG TPA: hypothetical protein VI704_06465 [Bacteroidota bacterium]|nr:hypothetical protein [Bacteroidota bacterium]
MTAKTLGVSTIIGYALSTIFLVFGVVVLLGLAVPDTLPKQFRMTMGVVLVLWGVYRFVLTKMKRSSPKAEDA